MELLTKEELSTSWSNMHKEQADVLVDATATTEVSDYQKAVKLDKATLEVSIWNGKLESTRGTRDKNKWTNALDILRKHIITHY
eukprot:391006-Ditylum_brightwellii.AAC.1